uniref:C-type lectin domain-containing protein n=1 Tax=Amphilophus citrinellus TaxID=61819 RepID=A0A3Q0SY73_AMPCI
IFSEKKFYYKTCPAGWRKFSCSCYLLSERSDSWDAARKDCRDREADLVVIESSEEQTFLSTVTKEHTWIGLNDKEKEGTWKWVDGTALTLKNWEENQPDNGRGDPQWGEEDCAHDRGIKLWNDISCSASFKWICEKMP